MNPIIMHINYGENGFNSFGDRSIDDICRMAANTGFDGIEFRGAKPVELKQLSFREYAEQIGAAKKKYGLTEILFGIAVADCCDADSSKRKQSVEAALEMAKIAQELCGTRVCNTFGNVIKSADPAVSAGAYQYHGSSAATEEQWKLTVDTFRQLGEGLEALGMRFAFETHMNYIHDLPAAARKLVDAIDSPAIGINMDYGNTVYFPERPTLEETIELYGDKLFYTHMKNSLMVPGTDKRFPTALSEGEINHRNYVKKLASCGFEGPVGIEAPRAGDRIWFASQDLAYVKTLF